MDALKKIRTAHRTSNKTLNELNTLLNKEEAAKEEVSIVFQILQDKMTELDGSSAKVISFVLEQAMQLCLKVKLPQRNIKLWNERWLIYA